ncbi:hypothetical protein [Flavobacterium sp. ZB4P13]|uniref:hypothetical protein n=1 Tax=Flavobacterium sp. ZB4P13 TaxID=3401728 RepID=UPI003AB016FE
MQEAVQSAINHLNVSADGAIKITAFRIASAIDMQDQLGKIKLGFPASFVTFNDDLSVMETLNFNTITP